MPVCQKYDSNSNIYKMGVSARKKSQSLTTKLITQNRKKDGVGNWENGREEKLWDVKTKINK